jgi:Ca2+-binding RTX toxin-like protein
MTNQRVVLLLTSMTVAIALASGVAFAAEISCSANPCFGTNAHDNIYGHQSAETSDQMYGYGDDDIIYGFGGDDILVGDGQDNTSLDGDDLLYAGDGNDYLYGYGGRDTFYAEAGNDLIDARENFPRPTTNPSNYDNVYGGGGNDTIYANDGYADFIDCRGGKKDKVYYDAAKDTLKHCEKKFPQL